MLEMTRKERLGLTDTPQSAIIKMGGGNPGALNVLCEIFKESQKIDPQNGLGGFAPILFMDTLKIYESRIWMLYNDVCGCRLDKMLGLLRCVQMGLLADEKIQHAIDNRGGGIDLDDAMASLKDRLPSFVFQETP